MRLPVFIVAISVFLSVSSCTDEFNMFRDEIELIATNEEAVVVYANICPQERINFIRINRGFTVENFYLANTNPDSIYFNSDKISVNAYKIRGDDTLLRYKCRDTLILKDLNGSFNAEYVKLHYFKSNALYHEGEQNIDFGCEIKYKDKVVHGRTSFLDFPELISFNENIHTIAIPGSGIDMSFYCPINSQIFEAYGKCSFYEKRNIGNEYDTLKIEFKLPFGRIQFPSPVSMYNTIVRFHLAKVSFFKYLEDCILSSGDTVNTVERWIGTIQFTANAGNSDMALFSSLTNSFNIGFHNNLSTYSNIENGLGFVFARSEARSNNLTFVNSAQDTIVAWMGSEYLFVKH